MKNYQAKVEYGNSNESRREMDFFVDRNTSFFEGVLSIVAQYTQQFQMIQKLKIQS